MASALRNQCSISLLIADPKLHRNFRDSLIREGFIISDFAEENPSDAVLLDSFFLEADAAGYVRRVMPYTPVLCALDLLQKERSAHLLPSVDEIIELPANWRFWKTTAGFCTLIENCRFFKIVNSPEYHFGQGLWASLFNYFKNIQPGMSISNF